MTFDELVLEVYDITNRPDLVGETKSALKAATLKAHHLDFFAKDLFETGVTFPELGFRQALDYIGVVSNFRQLKYLRKAEDACDDTGIFFTVITPEEILDEYGVNRTDVAYVAGRVLQIRSSTEFQFSYMGCYLHPIIREGAYCSWIAQQYPFSIINEAVRKVFKGIGKTDESREYTQLVGEEYELLKLSNIEDVGS